MDTDYKEIGKRTKIARIRENITQEALAEKISLSTPHMSNVETGNTKVSLPAIIRIANASWNQDAIAFIVKDFKIEKSLAKKVFIDMWLFSSCLAVQLATNNMNISETDIDMLLNDFYERIKSYYITRKN